MPAIPPLRKRSQRPETDYERWLRQQDEHFTPGDHPVYDPRGQRIAGYGNVERNNHRFWYGQDGSWRDVHKAPPAYGYFIQPHSPSASIASSSPFLSCLSTIYGVLCFLLLVIILSHSAKALRKRRGRDRLSMSEQPIRQQ